MFKMENTVFKVGDKVKYVLPDYGKFVTGEIYTVSHFEWDEEGKYVGIEEIGSEEAEWDVSRFERVKEEEEMNEWVEWDGRKGMPKHLKGDERVEWVNSEGDGSISYYCEDLYWDNPESPVVKYRVVSSGYVPEASAPDVVAPGEEFITVEQDFVNHPNHYQGKVECIDAIESAVAGKTGLSAVCTANVIKYLWRCERKNGLEDLKKAQWYLNKLIEHMEEQHG